MLGQSGGKERDEGSRKRLVSSGCYDGTKIFEKNKLFPLA